jgi:hypothetical protein
LLAWCCCRGGALLLHLDIQGPTLTNLSRSGEAAIQMSSTEKQSNSFEAVCIRLNAIVNLKAAQDLFNASRVPTPFSISQGKIWDQQVDPREIAQTPNAGTKRIIGIHITSFDTSPTGCVPLEVLSTNADTERPERGTGNHAEARVSDRWFAHTNRCDLSPTGCVQCVPLAHRCSRYKLPHGNGT